MPHTVPWSSSAMATTAMIQIVEPFCSVQTHKYRVPSLGIWNDTKCRVPSLGVNISLGYDIVLLSRIQVNKVILLPLITP
jgi:hypothetical protein